MSLTFITGNQGKYEEACLVFPDLIRLDIDLPEIQEIDPKKIIEEKLKIALKDQTGEFIVEDNSVALECLGGLPGPLIKWFLKTVGLAGLSKIAEKMGNNKAIASVMIGYAKNKSEIKYFSGSVAGQIVAPRGQYGFGWDKIFQPEGDKKTFGEMTRPEKAKYSMRQIALLKLKKYLVQKNDQRNNF